MICKICHQNETNSTSGICDEHYNYPQELSMEYFLTEVAKIYLDSKIHNSEFARILLKLKQLLK